MAGKQLNQNNFLRWEGNFREVPFIATAVNDSVDIIIGNAFGYEFTVLSNDIATYGIDYSSFEFITQDNEDIPATFNSATGLVRYFLPSDAEAGDERTITYRWQDTQGNYSNTATVTINVEAEPGIWIADEASGYCLLDENGHNTGMFGYMQLQRYAGNPVIPVEPPEYKPNVDTDPDYVPPEEDLVSCALYVPPVALRFQIGFPFTTGIDPAFELIGYELRKTSDNSLVQSAPLNMHANSENNTQPNVESDNYKLTLTLTGGLADGHEKWVHIIIDGGGGTGADAQYLSSPMVFTGLQPDAQIKVYINGAE